jgi:hypothetical protein
VYQSIEKTVEFRDIALYVAATAPFTHEVLDMSMLAMYMMKKPIIGNAGLLTVG